MAPELQELDPLEPLRPKRSRGLRDSGSIKPPTWLEAIKLGLDVQPEPTLLDAIKGAPTTGESLQGAASNMGRAVAETPINLLYDVPAILGSAISKPIVEALGGEPRPASETRLGKWGTALRGKVADALPVPESVEKNPTFLNRTLPQALGSTAGFAATGGLGGTAGIAVTGALSQGASAYQEAKERSADDDTALTAFALSLPIGATEAIPLGRLFARINRASNGGVARVLGGMAAQAGEEGMQEAGAQALSNVVQQFTGDEERKIVDGLLESGAAGAIVGALFGGVGGALQSRSTTERFDPVLGPENEGDPIQEAQEGRSATDAVDPSLEQGKQPTLSGGGFTNDAAPAAQPTLLDLVKQQAAEMEAERASPTLQPESGDVAAQPKLGEDVPPAFQRQPDGSIQFQGADGKSYEVRGGVTTERPATETPLPSAPANESQGAEPFIAPVESSGDSGQLSAAKKPLPAGYSATARKLPALFHDTSPSMAVTIATASMDLSGLNVTPMEDFALGQGGRGALVEFADLDNIEVMPRRSKPGAALVEQSTGIAPEWEVLKSPGIPKGLVKSITFPKDTTIPRRERMILKGNGWVAETLDDGRIRYTPPAPVSEKRSRLADTDAEIAAAIEELGRKAGRTTRATGLDPETLAQVTKIAGLYVKRGAQTVDVFVSEMVERLGEEIRPYLESAWAAASGKGREEAGTAGKRRETGVEQAGSEAGNPPVEPPQAAAEPAPDRAFDIPDETRFEGVRRKLQDYFLRVRTVQQAVKEQGGVLDDKSDAYLAEELAGSQASTRIRRLRKTALRDVGQAMARGKLDSEAVNRFLIARHAADRRALMEQRNPEAAAQDPAFGAGMTLDDAARVLAEVEAGPQAAQFEAIAERIDRVNAARRMLLVESGLESEEAIAAWEEQFGPKYVPLRTVDAEEGLVPGGMGRGMSLKRPESMRAEGRSSLADNPLADTFAQMERTIARAAENRVRLALLEFVRANPDPALWEETEGPQTQDPNFQPADNVVPVKENGNVRLIVLHDARMAQALKRLQVAQAGTLLRWAQKGARTFSALNTSLNPEFVASNLAKDLQTAGVHLAGEKSAKMAARVLKGVPGAAKGIFRARYDAEAKGQWESAYRELEEAGGTVGWYDLKSIQELQGEIDKTIREATGERRAHAARLVFSKVGEAIEIANASVENSLRLSAFVEAKKAGLSTERAASIAKNLTVNFNRKGEWSNVTNTLWVFSNAGIQGSARMMSALKRSPRVRKIAAGIIVAGFVSSLTNRLLGGEDDDGNENWDKIPDWQKQKNFIVLLPDGSTGVQVPLPWGYNFFHVLGAQIEEMMFGGKKPTEALANVMTSAADAFNPLGDNQDLLQMLSFTILDPIVQQAENKTFTGAPIRPTQSPFERVRKPDSEQYWPDVSPMSKGVARTLNDLTGGDKLRSGLVDVSPEILEHWGRFVTGGAGATYGRGFSLIQRLVSGEKVPMQEMPFVRRFVAVEDPRHEHRGYERNADAIKQAQARQKEGLPLNDEESALIGLEEGLQAADAAREQAFVTERKKEGLSAKAAREAYDRSSETSLRAAEREIKKQKAIAKDETKSADERAAAEKEITRLQRQLNRRVRDTLESATKKP